MTEKPASLNTQLYDAVARLAVEGDHLAKMSINSQKALHDETVARNRVNEAQKDFDALVALVKKSAPRDTDWQCPIGMPAEATP